MNNRKENKGALAAVAGGNIIFGFSFLFSRLALEITVPTVLIAVRFTVAFLILNLVVFFGTRIRKKDGSPLLSFSLRGKPKKDLFLLALFQPVIYFAAENYGIVYTSSAFAGIIIAMIPLAGIVFDVLLMKEKVTRRQVLCAVGSVIGVMLTAIGAGTMRSTLPGLLLLLVAVAAGALFYVFSKRSGSHYSALERTYCMFAIGSITYLVAALLQCGNDLSPIAKAIVSPVFWAAIGYLSLVSSVIAFLLLNYGSMSVSVTRATLFANFTTVISIFAGVGILKEPFSAFQAVGAVIILFCVTAAQTRKANKDCQEEK